MCLVRGPGREEAQQAGRRTPTVNFATETARVSFPATVSTGDLISVVEQAGYSAVLPTSQARPGEEDGAGEADALRLRLLVSLALAIPVVVLAMVSPLQFRNWQWASRWPPRSWGAWPFHRAAAVNARHGAATMDTLISVGVAAAYLWSLYALFFGAGATYLEVAAGVTALVLLGRYLEARAKRRSGAALPALLSLGAKDVAVLRDGIEAPRVPVAELSAGESFVVRLGKDRRGRSDHLRQLGGGHLDAHRGVRACEVGPGDGADRRARERRRSAGRARHPGGHRHPARPDGPAGDRGDRHPVTTRELLTIGDLNREQR